MALASDPLTTDEQRELSRLFSNLIARIHDLPSSDTHVLIGIDDRMRGDALTRADLDSLRRMNKDHVRP